MNCKKLFLYFLGVFFLLSLGTTAQNDWYSGLYFRDVPVAQGLSQSSVYCLLQDNKGFVWIGTKDGLNRYDGYEFLTYKYEKNNPESLSNNEVICLENDHDKYLWIGTRSGGINRFEFSTGKITRFTDLTYDDLIQDLQMDSLNNLWAGTTEGLLQFHADESGERNLIRNVSETARFYNDQGKIIEPGKKNISISVIREVRKGVLLIGGEEGLFVYDIEKNEFTSVSSQLFGITVFTSLVIDQNENIWAGSYEGLFKVSSWDNPNETVEISQFSSNASMKERRFRVDWVEDLTSDKKGNIWVGTRGGGLYKISEGQIQGHYNYSSVNNASLPDDLINSLMIDRTGVLWVGTESKGLAYTDLFARGFHIIRPDPGKGEGLSDNLVTAITGGSSRIWVGTAASGIDVFTNRSNVISKVRNIPKVFISNQQFSREVMALLTTRKGDLWIGSATNSLSVYNEESGFKSYPVEGFIFSLFEDRNGLIWYGTWGQGLGYMDVKSEGIERYYGTVAASLGLSSDKILSIYEDSNGLLWVGTKGGGINVCPIDAVVARTGEFVAYRNSTSKTHSLSYNDVYDILEDQKGNIWLATGSGLNKVIPVHGKGLADSASDGDLSFVSYSENDGLAGGLVLSMEEDENGDLWMGTNKGISRFNPNKEVFTNFGVSDGLPSGEFHQNASYKNPESGLMYFGGVEGVAVFHPDSMENNPFPPKVQITGLRLHNSRVFPGEELNETLILDKSITYTDNLTLSHSNNELTFEFSALHFSNPDKIKYAFRLRGFNEEWQETGSNNRRATYTNLHEGDYVFEVKASDGDGKWSVETASVQVTILPPIWRSPWAYLLYIGLLVFLLFSFRKYSLIGAKQKNNLMIESIQHKKDRELSEAKMKFFTNISHEIRTPLTLIHAPLQDILSRNDINNEVHRSLSIMHRNVKRLLNMVNQLLEFRRIDTGHSEVYPVKFNLVELSKDTLAAFSSLALQKDIEVKVEAQNEIWLTADEKMISTALYNLLSNALKFTPAGGGVSLNLELNEEVEPGNSKRIVIRVCDTGTGIPEQQIGKVFERFSQGQSGSQSHLAGSGIGLSIVKEFVELNEGQVGIYNKPDGGCCFEINLPEESSKVKILTEEEVSHSFTSEAKSQPIYEDEDEEGLTDDLVEKEDNQENPVMCIVEDDHELANWLSEIFGRKYNITLFHDGAEALSGIISLMPDIVICDLMLPGMLGTDLTSQLKDRFETSHIPIIMLTAKTGDENMLEGLKTGADSYITKPFNINILKAQVSSLVNSRLAFKQNFSGKLSLEPSEEAITTADEKFLSRLMEVTEENLNDPSFDVSVLVDQMHMSHSIILKKIKSLTGLSLVEFIRSMRIKKAAQIFRQDKLSVSEVSFMVGFSDPKYFSKCFSKQMGKKPTQYIKEHHM